MDLMDRIKLLEPLEKKISYSYAIGEESPGLLKRLLKGLIESANRAKQPEADGHPALYISQCGRAYLCRQDKTDVPVWVNDNNDRDHLLRRLNC